jgi:hypothetical protein
MANITLRLVKGSSLTYQELDDNMSNLNSFKVEGRSGSLTTTATTANQVVDTVSASTIRTLRYIIQASNSTLSSYHTTSVMLIHDGTTVYLTEYATVMTGNSLATFDADISGGNLRLLVTPANASSTVFKFSAMTVAV